MHPSARKILLFSSSQTPAYLWQPRQERVTLFQPKASIFSPSPAGFISIRHTPAHRCCSGPGLSPHCLHTTAPQFAALARNGALKIKRKARHGGRRSKPALNVSKPSQPAQSSALYWRTQLPPPCWLTALLQSRSVIQKQKRLFICCSSGDLLSCSLSSSHLRAGMAAI